MSTSETASAATVKRERAPPTRSGIRSLRLRGGGDPSSVQPSLPSAGEGSVPVQNSMGPSEILPQKSTEETPIVSEDPTLRFQEFRDACLKEEVRLYLT